MSRTISLASQVPIHDSMRDSLSLGMFSVYVVTVSYIIVMISKDKLHVTKTRVEGWYFLVRIVGS